MSFDRSIYFKNLINYIQGKGAFENHTEIIKNFKNQIKNNKISYDIVKEYLKNNNYQNYYEFIPFILKNLNVKVIQFTDKQVNQLVELFDQVNEKYYTLFKNEYFLSYNYVLYKLAEFIGHNDFKLIKIPNNEHIIKFYDNKWKRICEELDWLFVETKL